MEEKTTDLCDRYPHAPTLPAGFRDFGASTRFSGPAMTVQCFEDNSRIKELSLTPGEGRVLVVDGGASQRCALLGDVIAADLVKNGWRGAIIYGCVRDAAVLASLPLGIKALTAHPRRSQKHGAGVSGAPIDIGNARVQAGDVIVADEDGVVAEARRNLAGSMHGSLARQREMLLKSQARHVQHMQKALTQMNIQLANVISDVVGVTGQKILRAIVAGERDGLALAACKDVRIHASAEDIAKSLQGNWRAEHVFALKQALALFDFIGTQLAECDREIEAQLQSLQAHDGEPAKGKKRSKARNALRRANPLGSIYGVGQGCSCLAGRRLTTSAAPTAAIGPWRSARHQAATQGVRHAVPASRSQP